MWAKLNNPSTKPRILLVEDDNVQLAIQVVLLENAGFTVVAKSTAMEALLEYLNGEPYDLVCTDLDMPDVSGVELIEQLHLGRKNPRIVVVSGVNRPDVKRTLSHYNITFVAKPFSPSHYLETIRKTINSGDH